MIKDLVVFGAHVYGLRQCTTLRSGGDSTSIVVEIQHELVSMPWVLHWDSTQSDNMVLGEPRREDTLTDHIR